MTNTFSTQRAGMVLLSILVAAFAGAAPISADGGETDSYAGGAVDTYAQSGSHQDSMVWSGETDLAGEADVRTGSSGITEQAPEIVMADTDAWIGGVEDTYAQAGSHQDSMVWSGETDLAGGLISDRNVNQTDSIVPIDLVTPSEIRVVKYMDGFGETDGYAGGSPNDRVSVIAFNVSSIDSGKKFHHMFAFVKAGATDLAAGIELVSWDICDTHELDNPAVA